MIRAAASVLAAVLLVAAGCAAAQAPAPVPAVISDADGSAPVMGYQVVREYPHDPTAFTQGLIYRDGWLYESTGRAPSSIRQVRLEDGAVLQKRELDPMYFSEGLTDWGDRLISLTWRNHLGFVWSISDLSPITGFVVEGEGWGLTQDGRRLILSDGSATLRFLDPASMAETGRVEVTDARRPVKKLNELEWIDADGEGPRPGEVWANVWETDRIARIDPETGRVTAWLDLTGLIDQQRLADPYADVLNGIAWDAEGRRLFVTGKNWPALFEIEVVETRRP